MMSNQEVSFYNFSFDFFNFQFLHIINNYEDSTQIEDV